MLSTCQSGASLSLFRSLQQKRLLGLDWKRQSSGSLQQMVTGADVASLTVGHAAVTRQGEEDRRDRLGHGGQGDARCVEGDVAAVSCGTALHVDPRHRV